MATLATLRGLVRRMAGRPDIVEYPNDDIDEILQNDALEWLNKRRPGRRIRSFTTVADQQDYDAKPSDAYLVTDVWWMESDFQFFSPSMKYVASDHDINYRLAGFSVLEESAIVEAFHKQLETYKGNFKGEGYEYDDGKIRLEPVPGTTGETVYFECTYPLWSGPTVVPARCLPAYKAKAAEQVLRELAIKRGRVRSTRSGSGGGGENEAKEADRLKKKANAELPGAGLIIAVR